MNKESSITRSGLITLTLFRFHRSSAGRVWSAGLLTSLVLLTACGEGPEKPAAEAQGTAAAVPGKETKKAATELGYGEMVDSVYQNEYFGLRMPVPKEWFVQDQTAQRKLMEKGVKVMTGDDEKMKQMFKTAVQQSVIMLTVFQHEVGSPVPFNPGIVCMAETVKDFPGVKRGKDYLYHAQRLMKTGQIKFEFPKEFYPEKVGAAEFDVMEVQVKAGPLTVKQKYYAMINKGYALLFIASYSTEEEEAALQKVLQGVTLE